MKEREPVMEILKLKAILLKELLHYTVIIYKKLACSGSRY
jgi:hypothetical protein